MQFMAEFRRQSGFVKYYRHPAVTITAHIPFNDHAHIFMPHEIMALVAVIAGILM